MIFCHVGKRAPPPVHVCHTLPMCVLRIEHRSRSTCELWNESATPKFYVGVTGEGVRYGRTAPRIEGHSSISFQGPHAMGAAQVTLPGTGGKISRTNFVAGPGKRPAKPYFCGFRRA